MFTKLRFWHRFNATIESHYHDEKKQFGFLQTLKSCSDHSGSIEVDVSSRDEYQRAGERTTVFEGKEVYGVQAEYLDEDDMAWGKSTRRNYGSFVR